MMTLMGTVFGIISACFHALGILAVLSIILLIIFYNLNSQNKRWNSWRKIADINKLSFTLDGLFNRAQVFGKYRGYHLNLESFQRGSGSYSQFYTRLTLATTHKSPQSVSPTNSRGLDMPQSVDDAITLLRLVHFDHHNIREKIKADPKGRRISYETPGIETDTKYLQFLFDWLSDIADAYPVMVALGGETVAHLHSLAKQNSRLRPLATQLLHDIADDTITRLSHRSKDLICPACLTFCSEHKIKLSWWKSITYYGCRTCHQSREFFEGWMIALLDNQTTQEQVQQNGVLRVNWLTRRTLFDFDEVEIVQATDEDVERFAVQVGNDTDPLRKSRYRQMRCVVSADCGLSENTRRILQRMFGSVELEPAEFIREVADIYERTTNNRNGATDSQAVHPARCAGSSTFGR